MPGLCSHFLIREKGARFPGKASFAVHSGCRKARHAGSLGNCRSFLGMSSMTNEQSSSRSWSANYPACQRRGNEQSMYLWRVSVLWRGMQWWVRRSISRARRTSTSFPKTIRHCSVTVKLLQVIYSKVDLFPTRTRSRHTCLAP